MLGLSAGTINEREVTLAPEVRCPALALHMREVTHSLNLCRLSRLDCDSPHCRALSSRAAARPTVPRATSAATSRHWVAGHRAIGTWIRNPDGTMQQ